MSKLTTILVSAWRKLAYLVVLVCPVAATAASYTTFPALMKAFLIPTPAVVRPSWDLGGNFVQWETPRPIMVDQKAQQLYRGGAAQIKIMRRVLHTTVYVLGTGEFPDSAAITLNEDRESAPGDQFNLANYDFVHELQKAGFIVEKLCSAKEQLVSFGTDVYRVKVAGYQAITVSYDWEVAEATHGSIIVVTVAYAKATADGFKCH